MSQEELSPSPRPVRRRELLRGLTAAAVTGMAVTAADAQAPESPAVTPDEVAAVTRLAGRAYSASEREMMARSAGRSRANLLTMRAERVRETVDPSVRFDAELPETPEPVARRYRVSRGSLPAVGEDLERLAFASVAELSRLIKARKVTSTALTRMYLDRLKRYGPRLLCVVNLTEELALAQAARADNEIARGKYRGPLHGIPWGAKDLLATRGIPTTWGVKPYANRVFDYDATVVQRLEEAGAVLVAKLTLGELAMGDVWFGGVTRNPWDPKRGSSGSSAGPGSATAAGLVGFSIGSETLGSIVSPSVANGVTGLRPTFGRVPRTGAMALSWTMDKLGPMCRSVEDCALVLTAIYGPDRSDATAADRPFDWNPTLALGRIRIGIDRAAFDAAGRSAARAKFYRDVISTLESLGMQPIPVTLPPMKDAYRPIASTVINVEGASSFAELLETGRLAELVQQGPGSWPNTFRVGSTIPAVDYLQAHRLRSELQREVAAALKDVDVFVTVPFAGANLVQTNLTGHPSLVTRCGLQDGQPVSVEFIGGLWKEAELLRVAHAYEQATPWHKQWPDVTKLPEAPPPLAR